MIKRQFIVKPKTQHTSSKTSKEPFEIYFQNWSNRKVEVEVIIKRPYKKRVDRNDKRTDEHQ